MVFEGDLLKDYRLDFKDNKLVRVELPNVEERKTGEWVKTGGSFRCSECMVMPEFKDIRTLKFCPNCGAEMTPRHECRED